MSVGNQLDANVLGWVKSELDETLGQARSVLEVYVENPDDESQLRFCLNYLHQVYGTLQMVELYGASLAAEEMERLVEALVEDKVSNRNDAYEVLIRGILQLPDYLEQLLHGQADMPMVLLPLLNDLRAARGESLLSENAMFAPDLSVEVPAESSSVNIDTSELTFEAEAPVEHISELAKKLRHNYHLGLLGWFRDKDSNASLKRIADVINALRQATDDKEIGRLLWTASGLVESLQLGGLDSSISVKLLLGQLDRQIKKIIDNGVAPLSEEPPEELLKNILYYVATSNSDGDVTQEVKQAFDLDNVLPNTQQLEQARADLQSPNVALMDTVSSVLMDDLVRAKDMLDIFVRAESPEVSELSSLCDLLNQMSDTLGMLGLGLQRRTIKEQVDVISEMVNGERSADEAALMDVAAAMLSIETSLQEMNTARAVNEASGADYKQAEGQMHNVEQHKLMQTVIEEVKHDLIRVKEAISDYSRNTMSPELISEVPSVLAQIKGSLSILSLERAADLLEQTANYVSGSILQATAAPAHSQLENLADAISSIEYYLESLAGGWGQPETILDVAAQSLGELLAGSDSVAAQETPKEQFAENNNVHEISTANDDDTLVDFAMSDVDDPSTDISSDINTVTDLTFTDLAEPSSQVDLNSEEGLTFDEFDESPMDLDIATNDNSGIEAASEISAPTIAHKHEVSDDIDDEIIEIFMEEAEEEYANIQRLLSSWESNLDNKEPLTDMRRSFHTLKGSGRLVGAAELGEFAWAFENMLNRVIDNTIEVSPDLFEVLHRGRDTLPVLFELFKTHSNAGQDVFTLMSYADALSKGESNIFGESENDSVILEPEESNISESLDSLQIDPVLLGIYKKEAEANIATLKEYVVNWKAGSDQTASFVLLRVLHTLNGSSRTADINSLSTVCGAFENYVKDIEGQDFSHQALEILESLIEFVEQTISLIGEPGVELPDNDALNVAITELHSAHEGSTIIESVDSLNINTDEEILVIDDNEHEVDSVVDFSFSDESSTLSEENTAVEDLGDDVDSELLEIFTEEAEEILHESDNAIHRWVQAPDDAELVEELQRQLHTLKGGARMAGISAMGDLGHDIESMLTAVVDGHLSVSKEMQTVLQRAQDRLVDMLEQVKAHKKPVAATDLISQVNVILGRSVVEDSLVDLEINITEDSLSDFPSFDSDDENLANVISIDAQEEKIEAPSAKTEQALVTEGDDSDERRTGSRIQHEQIRVRSDLLDNLVNFAGEVSIYRSRMEQQTNTFRFNLQELDDTIGRFRSQLRQFEIETETQIQYRKEDTLAQGYDDFDPLEMDRFTQMQHLSRGMLESLGDLDSLRSIFSNITSESETLLVQQSRVTSELQEGLMRTRLVQISGHAPRLRRIVRQVSDEMGKPVEFHLQGMDNELDRNILERVIPPVEHMLRNAVAHGIEAPQQRQQAGKAEAGNINIAFERVGGEFVIRISDDGAGINLPAIHRKAVEKGMLSKDAKPSKEILLELMMRSGFSTAEEVTQIAGRGVGMDVVDTEIKQLGGHLEISTLEGKGTVFTITMPLTLSVSRALMVGVGDETYAIPLLSVEGVERVTYSELLSMSDTDEPVYNWVGHDYKYMHLSSIMGMHEAIVIDEDTSVPILLVSSAGYRAAIQVDRLIGSREIVIKPVGPQLSTLRGVSGATIMGDGSVVLIIDPATLVRLMATEKDMQPAAEITTEQAVVEDRVPTIMVVDDSITVRKVTTRFLQRNDMAVTTAKDGVDALGQLQIEDNKPDVLLLDVEMPRMDGFELATNIRNDNRLKDIPIIMITSRTGAKHRERAMKIGANVYMGKPYNESELLEHINNLMEK